MDKWPYEIQHLDMGEILRAVASNRWQNVRKSLKGLPTSQKLIALQMWLFEGQDPEEDRVIQVHNYINALKRGGQLNLNNEVVR